MKERFCVMSLWYFTCFVLTINSLTGIVRSWSTPATLPSLCQSWSCSGRTWSSARPGRTRCSSRGWRTGCSTLGSALKPSWPPFSLIAQAWTRGSGCILWRYNGKELCVTSGLLSFGVCNLHSYLIICFSLCLSELPLNAILTILINIIICTLVLSSTGGCPPCPSPCSSSPTMRRGSTCWGGIQVLY